MKKVDLRKPATWVKYKPSLCNDCTAGCCHLPVAVDTEDLFHMGFLKAEEVNGPLGNVAKRLLNKRIVKTYRARSRTFVLWHHPNGRCVFLDDNYRCTIYSNRPAVCRRFPLNSAKPSFCPHEKKSVAPDT